MFQFHAKKSKRIDNYFSKEVILLVMRISRMTSLDGIPFSTFCTSTDLKTAIKALSLENLPQSSTTI